MDKYRPAILGGVLIGVLSGLPVVQAGNCCCCLWVVSGGLLTTYLLQKNTPTPIETTDAMLQGVLAGLLGAVIAAFMDIALAPIVGPIQQRMIQTFITRLQEMPNIPAESRTQLEEFSRQSLDVPLAARLIRSLMFVPVAAIMAMLGALLGVAFFRKKTPPAAVVQG